MATQDVMKELEVHAYGERISKKLGAEAQNIDVSFDANGDIIEDISVTSPASVEKLSSVLKKPYKAVTWPEQNFLGAKNLINTENPSEKVVMERNGITYTFNDLDPGCINVQGTATSESFYTSYIQSAKYAMPYADLIFTVDMSTIPTGMTIAMVDSFPSEHNVAWFGVNGETDGSKEIFIPKESWSTYNHNEFSPIFKITIQQGATIPSCSIRPMLRLATITDRTFEPGIYTNYMTTYHIDRLYKRPRGHAIVTPDDTELDFRPKLQFLGKKVSVRNDNFSSGPTKVTILDDTTRTFTITSTDWVANINPRNNTLYTVMQEITTSAFANTPADTILLGYIISATSDAVKTEDEELESAKLDCEVTIGASSIIVYATEATTVDLRLKIVGE